MEAPAVFRQADALVQRFLAYDWMIAFLSIQAIAGALAFGFDKTIPQVIVAVVSAVIVDSILVYARYKKIDWSKSAVISGLFVGGILAQSQPLALAAGTAALAMGIKHVVRLANNPIFNPAASGIIVSNILLNTSNTWWIATQPLLALFFGLIVSYRIKKLAISFSSIASYAVFFVVVSMAFYNTVLPASLVFASIPFFSSFFMLTEPKTTPSRLRGKIVFGIITSALALYFGFNTTLDFILASLLVSNTFKLLLNRL